MTSPKGWPTSKKSTSVIAPYTNSQCVTLSQFQTLHHDYSDHVSADVSQRGLYEVSASESVNAGSTKRLVKSTGHGAVKGDVIRFTSGALSGIDAPVLSVPDANNLILATELDIAPSAGDTFSVNRFTFVLINSDGSQKTSVVLTMPKLKDGDIEDAVSIDDTIGITLFTAAVALKKVRLAQNGGANLYIFKDLVKVGALEKGGVFEFDIDIAIGEAIILKTVSGTTTTSVSWNIFG